MCKGFFRATRTIALAGGNPPITVGFLLLMIMFHVTTSDSPVIPSGAILIIYNVFRDIPLDRHKKTH